MPIGTGYLLAGGARLNGIESGFFETYKGIVETQTGKIKAYVKFLHPKAVANEIICTAVGQAAGLPIPNGFIVKASRSDYPESEYLRNLGQPEAIVYASEDVRGASLARQCGPDDEVAYDVLLANWKRWEEAMLFDEWVANTDRHPGNLIIKSANDVWLIDHSHAFIGANWHRNDLKSASRTKNLIAKHANRTLSSEKRQRLLANIQAITGRYQGVNIPSLIEESRAYRFLDDADGCAVREFLVERVKSLAALIANHVGMPELPQMTGA